MSNLKAQLNYGGTGWADVDPPENLSGIEIDADWTSQMPNATVGGVDLIWVGKNATNIWNYRTQGLSGGLGITEGIGLRLFLECGTNNWVQFFDGYVNLNDPKTKWECDKVTAPSVEIGRTDWALYKLKSFDFAYLRSIGLITQSDYKKTPYCILKLSQAPLQQAMLALTELAVIKSLADAIHDIQKDVTSLSGSAVGITPPTTIMGTSVSTANVINIIDDGVTIVTDIITLAVGVKKIINSIWQFRKIKKCMREVDIWRKIAQQLNVNFASTIYSSSSHANDTWMPKKYVIPNPSNPLVSFFRNYNEEFDNNAYGHPDGLASSWVAEMCKKYNGAINIFTDPTTGQRTLHFEEIHHWNNQAVYTIPNTINNNDYAHNFPYPSTTNLGLLPWNYLYIYATDATDEVTLWRYQGTSCSKNVRQTTTNDIHHVNGGKGIEIRMSCAIGKRKNYLNEAETIVNGILNVFIGLAQAVVNTIAAIENGIISFLNLFGLNIPYVTPPIYPTNILNNRLGWLEVSDDKWQNPKTFTGIQQSNGDWALDPSSELICAANTMMTNFHQFNLPTHGNQQEIFPEKHMKLCCSDYLKILNKNILTTPDGTQFGKFTKMKWNPKTETATVDYSIYKIITNNLIETTVVDGN